MKTSDKPTQILNVTSTIFQLQREQLRQPIYQVRQTKRMYTKKHQARQPKHQIHRTKSQIRQTGTSRYEWVPVSTSGYQCLPVGISAVGTSGYQEYLEDQDQISGVTHISDAFFISW